MAENSLNPIFNPVRESIYLYHIQGLDQFLEDPDASRSAILEVLKKLQTSNRSRPNSIFTIAFLDAKSNELINIFSEGDMGVRRQAYEILRALDPTLTDKLGKILNN